MRPYRSWIAAATAALLLMASPATAAHAAPRLPGHILYLQFTGSTTEPGSLHLARPDGSSSVDLHRQLPWWALPDLAPDSSRIAYTESYSFRSMAVDGSDDRELAGAPCGPSHPRWSPDGKWIIGEACGDIWRVSSAGAQAGWSNLTGAYGYNDLTPAWAPGSRRFATATYPGVQIYRADGSSTRTLTDLPGAYRLAWSPAGRTLAVEALGDIWLFDVASGVGRQVTNTPDIQEIVPVWSPDGRWLAYGRGPGTHDENFPGVATDPTIWLMNATGGRQHSTGIHGVPTSWRSR